MTKYAIYGTENKSLSASAMSSCSALLIVVTESFLPLQQIMWD